MPRVLNLGSLNFDHSYRVPRFVKPGETLASISYEFGLGGKGLNQSIALARAGLEVLHLGAVGPDGAYLRDRLVADGVDVRHLHSVDVVTGHAVIQVESNGQNAIVLHAGANHALTREHLAAAFEGLAKGDAFLCQNETNLVADALRAARKAGLVVCFNPAPCTPAVQGYPLECVDYLFLNETEGEILAGVRKPDQIIERLLKRNPQLTIVLTLGAEGALLANCGGTLSAASPKVEVIDTTAAGDTFIGYFLASRLGGAGAKPSLDRACRAAAVCVQRRGAADSIPRASEVN